MNLEPNAFTTEISDALATTGENYLVKTTDLVDYGTSYEITKHGSTNKLCLTPVENSMIDMVLYTEKGNTLATCTLLGKNNLDITAEKLANLIALCF